MCVKNTTPTKSVSLPTRTTAWRERCGGVPNKAVWRGKSVSCSTPSGSLASQIQRQPFLFFLFFRFDARSLSSFCPSHTAVQHSESAAETGNSRKRNGMESEFKTVLPSRFVFWVYHIPILAGLLMHGSGASSG